MSDTDALAPLPPTVARLNQLFPTLTPSQIARVAAHGHRRDIQAGEVSLAGVFSVGDVRGGNVKRVASAVGEGAIAIALVHQVPQE